MKIIALFLAITYNIARAQLLTPGELREATVEDCMYNSPGFFFCTKGNSDSILDSTNTTTEGVGNCCPPDSEDNRCIDSGNPLEGIQCSMIIPATSNLTAADIGMFMTYEIDLQSERV